MIRFLPVAVTAVSFWRRLNVLVEAQAASRLRLPHGSGWFRRLSSAQQVEDVIYDRGRDYEVVTSASATMVVQKTPK
jgi:hypothetical protein